MTVPPDQAAAIILAGCAVLVAFLGWARAWFQSKAKKLGEDIKQNTVNMAKVQGQVQQASLDNAAQISAVHDKAAEANQTSRNALETAQRLEGVLGRWQDRAAKDFDEIRSLRGQVLDSQGEMQRLVSDHSDAIYRIHERMDKLSAENAEQGQRINDLELHIDQLYEGIALLPDNERQVALSKVTGPRPNGRQRKAGPPAAAANVDSTT